MQHRLEVIEDRPPRPTRVAHEQELVIRPSRFGKEPLRVGGLMERLHWNCDARGELRGEGIRRHEHAIVLVAHRRRHTIGVADQPQEVQLRRPRTVITESVEVDAHVRTGRWSATPLVEKMNARGMAAPLELALQGPREVVVAPRRRLLPIGDADEDSVALRIDPLKEVVADLGGTVCVRVAREHDLTERGLQRACLFLVRGRPVDHVPELLGRVRDWEGRPQQVARPIIVGHDKCAGCKGVEHPRIHGAIRQRRTGRVVDDDTGRRVCGRQLLVGQRPSMVRRQRCRFPTRAHRPQSSDCPQSMGAATRPPSASPIDCRRT